MYEIWLMLNIAWEIVRAAWPWALAWALAAAALLAIAVARGANWAAGLRVALVVAAVIAVVAFFLIPRLTNSSLAELKYWVDWLTVVGLALVAGGLVGVLTLPLAALLRRRSFL